MGGLILYFRCRGAKAECNCLPWLPPQSAHNPVLVAEGKMYHLQFDLLTHELADLREWDIRLEYVHPGERFFFTHRFLQWQVADAFERPMYWTGIKSNQISPMLENGGHRLPMLGDVDTTRGAVRHLASVPMCTACAYLQALFYTFLYLPALLQMIDFVCSCSSSLPITSTTAQYAPVPDVE